MHTRAPSAAVLSALLLLAVLACDASKPEFVDGETISIAGTLAAESVSNRHVFGVTNSGTVETRLISLAVTDPGTGELPETVLLLVQIGRPAGEECNTTRTELLGPDQFFTVFLESRIYCVRVSRSAALPADSVIDYAIRIESHF